MADIIPWHSDVVQRPVKFVRGGGFIVTMAPSETQFFVTPGHVTAIVLPPAPGFGPVDSAWASSCHTVAGKMVYLIVASIRLVSVSADAIAIYVSNDKKNWRVAFSEPASNSGEASASSGAVVWSKGAFHASYKIEQGPSGPNSYSHEFEVSSVNGESWSGAGDYGQVSHGEDAGYRSPFPGKYCTHHKCLDHWSQPVPDGVAYQGGKVSVQPTKPFAVAYSSGQPVPPPSPVNTITHISGGVVKTVGCPLDTVFCVGVSGGTWLAGGDGGLAASSNGGKNWQRFKIGSVDAEVTSISGE